MPAVQHRFVFMPSKPPSPDKQKLAAEEAAERDDKLVSAKPDLEDNEDDEDEDDDELELDDDEDDDEDLVVFTARATCFSPR